MFVSLVVVLTQVLYTEGDSNYCCQRCCPPPPERASCCDVCNPALSDFLSTMEDPIRPPRNPTQTRISSNDVDSWTTADFGLEEALEIWREQASESRWGPNHIIGGIGILCDDQIERIVGLARRQLVSTTADLQHELKWHYHSLHGAEVLAVVHSSHPPVADIPQTIKNATPSDSSNDPAASKIRIMRCSLCRQPGHNSQSLAPKVRCL